MTTSSGSTPPIQGQSTTAKRHDSGWTDAKCYGEGSTQLLDPTRNSYRVKELGPGKNMKMATITSLTPKTRRTKDHYIACT